MHGKQTYNTKSKKAEKSRLFHANEDNELRRVPGLRAMNDGAAPECFRTSEQRENVFFMMNIHGSVSCIDSIVCQQM